MSTALFGSVNRSGNKNLVEFRAGKMTFTESTKVVSADKRKGLVYLYQSEDQLLHFCWKDRTSGNLEDDLIIFPEDCEFKKISQCKTGRVFLLNFKSSSRKIFFWMQEPKTEKDEDYCRKINDLMNNPSSASAMSSSSRSSGASGREPELQNLIGNMSQQQLLQILSSGVPDIGQMLGVSTSSGSSTTSTSSASAADTATTTTTSSSSATAGKDDNKNAKIQLSDLQSILSNIVSSDGASKAAKPEVNLSHSMSVASLQPILTNESFVEELKPFLPTTGETMPSVELLRGAVTSAPFKQAVSLFSHAMTTGQLGPLMSQFGMSDEVAAAASSGDMEAFVKALEKSKSKPSDTKSSDTSSSADKKDQDEDDNKMNVD